MAKTTFVVAFGEGADTGSNVVVELEPSLNLDSDGNVKSSFSPGDEVYFTIHYPPNLRVGDVSTTSGGALFISRGEFRREQGGVLFVTPDDDVMLQHTPSSPLTFFWFGKVGQLSISGAAVKATNAPCIGDVSYMMLADLYRFSPPPEMVMNPEGQFQVGIVITMEAN